MLNLWIQAEHPFATWDCAFDTNVIQVPQLVEFLGGIVRSGEAHHVLAPLRLPDIEYRRDQTASVANLLLERWERSGILDLSSLAGPSAEVGATVCLYDATDRLVEKTLNDLGAELRSLEPAPGAIPDGFTKPFPPVRVWGIRIIRSAQWPPTIRVTIELHSDIWFPYIFGSAHPLVDFRRRFDNRALACCHTPRLNAFLRDVRAQATILGGLWALDVDGTVPPMLPWVGADGIDLDGPVPELMPHEALSAEWY